MKQLLIFVFLISIIGSCSSPKSVHVMHVRDMEAEAGHKGFYYALPRTVLAIDVTIKKTEKTPGPFGDYSSTMLGLTDIIETSSVKYEISDINISSYAEPDPGQFYFVKYDSELFEGKPFYLSFTESGLLKSVNTDFDSESQAKTIDDHDQYGYYGTEATFNYFINKSLKEKIDTIVEFVVKDTVIVERQILKSSWVEKGSKIKAQEVADFIIEIRNQKMDLISGFHEIPYSKETIEYMYTKLEEVEQDYLELFTGISSTSKFKHRFIHLPHKANVGSKRPLFRFCSAEGVFPLENKDKGTLVTIELDRQETTRQPGVFISRNIDPKVEERGFYYRIPEHAKATIKKGSITKADARLLVNQFGTISYLPPEHFEVEFYPNSGFIKSAGKAEIKKEE